MNLTRSMHVGEIRWVVQQQLWHLTRRKAYVQLVGVYIWPREREEKCGGLEEEYVST